MTLRASTLRDVRPGSGKGDASATSNEAVLDHVLAFLQHGQFTGQLILHVNSGVIRKTETRDFISTEDLLSK